jgi:hypothetical protein
MVAQICHLVDVQRITHIHRGPGGLRVKQLTRARRLGARKRDAQTSTYAPVRRGRSCQERLAWGIAVDSDGGIGGWIGVGDGDKLGAATANCARSPQKGE